VVQWAQYSDADGYIAHSGILRGALGAGVVYCIHTAGK
jgi:hypothetical protein